MSILQLFLLLPSCHSISMIKLSVPTAVENGKASVILDCLYSYSKAEAEQLRLRWFYNENPSPFYQWVAGRKASQPEVIGRMFADKIDMSHMASTDQHTMHRAIMIKQVSTDMTGTYTCVVDTLTMEMVAEANMLVFSLPVETQFTQRRLSNSRLNISCQFIGVYPVPDVRLFLGSVHLVEDGRQVQGGHQGYTVTVWKVFSQGTHGLGCWMGLPGTGYGVRLHGRVRVRGQGREEELQGGEALVIILLRAVMISFLGLFALFHTCSYAWRRFTLGKTLQVK